MSAAAIASASAAQRQRDGAGLTDPLTAAQNVAALESNRRTLPVYKWFDVDIDRPLIFWPSGINATDGTGVAQGPVFYHPKKVPFGNNDSEKCFNSLISRAGGRCLLTGKGKWWLFYAPQVLVTQPLNGLLLDATNPGTMADYLQDEGPNWVASTRFVLTVTTATQVLAPNRYRRSATIQNTGSQPMRVLIDNSTVTAMNGGIGNLVQPGGVFELNGNTNTRWGVSAGQDSAATGSARCEVTEFEPQAVLFA